MNIFDLDFKPIANKRHKDQSIDRTVLDLEVKRQKSQCAAGFNTKIVISEALARKANMKIGDRVEVDKCETSDGVVYRIRKDQHGCKLTPISGNESYKGRAFDMRGKYSRCRISSVRFNHMKEHKYNESQLGVKDGEIYFIEKP